MTRHYTQREIDAGRETITLQSAVGCEVYSSRQAYHNQKAALLAELASGPVGMGLSAALDYMAQYYPSRHSREAQCDWLEPHSPEAVAVMRAEYAKLGTFREYLETREAA